MLRFTGINADTIRRRTRDFLARAYAMFLALACSFCCAVPAYASGAGTEGGATMTQILSGVTELLTWILSSMTSVSTWILGNSLAFIYVGLFLAGAAMGFLFCALRSV
ncbi:MAG: hypothetical protein HFG62_06020 [Lachnospiraceae bacterium]|jgi:hypothetical protein|nr:hypothetical protein [Lachnospiraceae bacterium]